MRTTHSMATASLANKSTPVFTAVSTFTVLLMASSIRPPAKTRRMTSALPPLPTTTALMYMAAVTRLVVTRLSTRVLAVLSLLLRSSAVYWDAVCIAASTTPVYQSHGPDPLSQDKSPLIVSRSRHTTPLPRRLKLVRSMHSMENVPGSDGRENKILFI